MKLGSRVKTLTACRDNFGDNHAPGQGARIVTVTENFLVIEFDNLCVFKRGRATVPRSKVELVK